MGGHGRARGRLVGAIKAVWDRDDKQWLDGRKKWDDFAVDTPIRIGSRSEEVVQVRTRVVGRFDRQSKCGRRTKEFSLGGGHGWKMWERYRRVNLCWLTSNRPV